MLYADIQKKINAVDSHQDPQQQVLSIFDKSRTDLFLVRLIFGSFDPGNN
jgi:hypothetical protein